MKKPETSPDSSLLDQHLLRGPNNWIGEMFHSGSGHVQGVGFLQIT